MQEVKAPLRAEVWLVLAVSLGQSGVYALLSLIRRLLADKPLSEQTVTLNPSVTPNPWLDLTYQLVGILFSVVPALLAIYLLSIRPGDGFRVIGLDRRSPGFDAWWGTALAAVIGLPGLALYFGAKALGLNANVVPAALQDAWWAIPVLILSAVQNAVLEEVVVVGYLLTRLKEFDWRTPAILAATAVLRGSYHLYQGFGAFVGNAIMGVVFGLFFLRFKRVMPLVVAHTLLDVVAFVGYTLFWDRLH